jgi:hypothetical protein
LISSENRIYDPDDWTIKSSRYISIKIRKQERFNPLILSLVGSNQEYRLLTYWYEIGSVKTTSEVLVKIIQSFGALIAKPGSGRIVIYSSKYMEEDYNSVRKSLIDFVKTHSNDLM